MEEITTLIALGILAIMIWPVVKMIVGFILLVIYEIMLAIGALATLALLGFMVILFMYCLYKLFQCFSEELDLKSF